MNGIRKHRASRAKTPSRGQRSKSPWSRRSTNRENENDIKNNHFKIQESEINVFQQLCLGKHDENAAIEILLDSPDRISNLDESFSDYSDVGPTFQLSSIQEDNASIDKNSTFSTASISTGNGSSVRRKQTPSVSTPTRSIRSSSRELSKKKAEGMEAKRMFLNRFFFKSSPKRNNKAAFPVVADAPVAADENVLTLSHTSQQSKPPQRSNTVDRRSSSDTRDTFRAATTGKWSTPKTPSYRTNAAPNIPSNATVLSERFDSFSNVSDLSGSLATSYRHTTPFQRQQSLGIESIKDIRMCLQEMETQLARASNKGQRVSRHKLVKALFVVADSLDDSDEKTQVKAELEDAMKTENGVVSQLYTHNEQDDEDNEELDDVSSSTEEDFTYASGTSAEEEGEEASAMEEASPFNIMSFFGVSSENQAVMGEAFDDLMWNDFVSSRKEKERGNDRQNPRNRALEQAAAQRKSHKVELHVKDFGPSTKSRAQSLPDNRQPERTRSWWRNHPSKNGSDFRNERRTEEESSTDTEEFSSYLPTSITVKKKSRETDVERSSSAVPFAQHGNRQYNLTMHQQQQQQQPHLIETESRIGFEMGRASSQSRAG
ncbi:MAG: hypothetical protein SGILL_003287 [Bacillariaceae sp.]